jgi:pimeloyl-ACP methyl ester carboxylesterase
VSYADVNGMSLYYEEHGSGQPLILLYGGLAAASMYAPIQPMLAKDRRVIAVDLQAHGHTADVDRPLRYQTLGDDVAALIGHLGLAQADLMGYSFGAATALRTAIQHPHLVRRLVVVSAPCQRDGWYPESLAGMDQMGSHLAEPLKQSQLYGIYATAGAGLASAPGQDR